MISCLRLGRKTQNRPRRLRVRLRNEEAATSLLRSSRLLRSLEDEVVAKSVYINKDLTPTAAKLAYEDRLRRRQEKQARQNVCTRTCKEVSGVENIGQCGRLSQLRWLLGAL